MPDNLCTATTHAGTPCRRKKVHGSDRCQAHGGVAGKAVFDETKLKSRCTAKSSRSGEQCRKAAIKGGTVCRTHGGALPTVQKRAKERWRELEEPMVALTERMVEKAATGNMSDGDTLRLMSFLADRMGYQRGITVEHTQDKPWEVTMRQIVTEVPAYELDEIEDAEVVEESLPPVADVSKLERFDGPRIYPNAGQTPTVRGSADPIPRKSPYDA
ncbi:hypothetical protein LVJ59_02800 [Microbacterium sp. KKR3/1]|uniref:hypothetical protein n=1 Tax=Microbacterium sp. KKR3/1 TaxID=2904241 RepID=UPI001E534D9D|nr:hypothetical protein [Microbacterium sp. KKR3/1]MCE0507953.1 hypothetical protein [Microbacterium sp. KKR3/1]